MSLRYDIPAVIRSLTQCSDQPWFYCLTWEKPQTLVLNFLFTCASRKKTHHLLSSAAFYPRVRHYTSTRWHAWWRLSPIQRKLGRNWRSNLRVSERRLPSIESSIATNKRTYGSLVPEHQSGRKKYRAEFFGHLKQHSLFRERSSIQLSLTCWMSHCILRMVQIFPHDWRPSKLRTLLLFVYSYKYTVSLVSRAKYTY